MLRDDHVTGDLSDLSCRCWVHLYLGVKSAVNVCIG